LLTSQYDGKLYRYDPKTGETEVVCNFLNTLMVLWHATITADGTIYAALSGGRMGNPNNPYEVMFGQRGVIMKVRTADESFSIVPGSDELQDPAEANPRAFQNGWSAVRDESPMPC
jgi:hypothetical protein